MTATGRDSATADRTIIITRTFDAPRELVFEAWTDPAHIGRWWGPDGFTTTTYEMNVWPRGVWRFVMHGPDGIDYANLVVYTAVVRPERLEYDHSDGDGSNRFHSTVRFDESDGKTAVTLMMTFDSAAERNRHVEEFGAVEGGRQTLARLADYLKSV